MSPNERRMEILQVLIERKEGTLENLAFEFGVSKRTIQFIVAITNKKSSLIVSIRIERKNCIVVFSYSWVSNIFFKMDLTFCAGYATIATNER